MTDMAFEDTLPVTEPMVHMLAKRFGGACAKYGADADDFRQELFIWLMTHDRKVARWLTDGEEGRLYTALENECRDYAVDIRAQCGGQDRQSAYWYTQGELEELLDCVYDDEKWLTPPQHDGEGSRSTKAPQHGGNWIASLADVSRGLDKLHPDDRELLECFHRDGASNAEMAANAGCAESTMSERHGRSVRRLLEVLGGPAPDPMRSSGSDPMWRNRHSISSSAARAQQSGYYDE